MKLVGFFAELVGDLARGVSIFDDEGGSKSYDVNRLVAYLRGGVKIAATMGGAADPFNKDVWLEGVGSPLTDGEWVWPQELAYLVEEHRLALPEDFLRTLKSNGFRVPQLDTAQRRAVWEWWLAVI